MMNWLLYLTLWTCSLSVLCYAASKDQPHGHQGVLKPYNGKQLNQKVTKEQEKKLENGESIMINKRDGKTGMGMCIADINSPPNICMNKITDLKAYPKMVPHVKKVDIYEKSRSFDGSEKISAEFKVGLMGLSFGYFLKLKKSPIHNTFTWTLDYRYNSDFDDNVGHWQVQKHPTKPGWTRLLYSCQVKLFPWIPEFIVRFMTSSALKESTSWVKKESEKEAAKRGPGFPKFETPSWMKFKAGFIAKNIPNNDDMENDRARLRHAMRPVQPRMNLFK